MTFYLNREFAAEVSLGRVPGYRAIHLFGVATDCDSGIETDLWDGADGVTATDIWVAPTAARIHNIVSSSASDAAAGIGARDVLVSGLVDWDTPAVSEVITMNGTTPVPTVNSYVTVNLLLCSMFGSATTNVGTILATAAVDGTVTAAIKPTNARSLMAIFGLPSTQTLLINSVGSSILTGNSGANVTVDTLLDFRPNTADHGFVSLSGVLESEAFHIERPYHPPIDVPGPAIVKLQAISDSQNIVVSATVSAYLVDK